MTVREAFDAMDYSPAPESATEARAWIAAHTPFGLFIDGTFRPAATGRTFATTNPADGAHLADAALGEAADVALAVKAARAAQKGWAAMGGAKRARFLYALARHVQKHARLFAVLETLDNGKTIRESRDIDVPLVVRHFYHHAGWAAVLDETFPDHEPLGVAGQIIPWNFPLLMLAWKIAPALAAGNTVVLKPAEQTPLTALLFATICQDIGLPKGVVNIVTGAGETGAALVDHSDIDKIAFTGSTDVGRAIRKATAGSGKSLTLELGGKSPFIIFDDADLDGAVEGVVDSIWFNQGQVCCAGSRLLVQEGVRDAVLAKLGQRLEKLRVGDPLSKSVDMGPIVSAEQLARIRRLVAEGQAQGAGLMQATCPEGEGFYYPPTLLTGVEPADTVAQEEIFGPVLVEMSFRTPDEAVALANNTRYGLAASVWTENINLALDIAPKLQAGVVWTNAANLLDAAAGFGGVKESGYGREGGREGMLAYLRPRPGKLPVLPKGKPAAQVAVKGIDRTAKLYIGGKQARPDGGYAHVVTGPKGTVIGHVGAGNRKDIRNAVEAARGAKAWSAATTFNRSQVMFYIAENLDARADEFAARLSAVSGQSAAAAEAEVAAAVETFFRYAGWADKYDGAVHSVPLRGTVLAMNEPIGVIGMIAPDAAPLSGFASMLAPALAMGNRVVIVPGATNPLVATDFYQVMDTSDVPGGAVNIVTGNAAELAPVLAAHNDVDALWYAGAAAGVAGIEALSTGNLKRLWVRPDAEALRETAAGTALAEATQVKNIWVPYGE